MIDHLIDRLEAASRWTTDLTKDIDEGRWFEAPREDLGHLAWQLGHIAVSRIALVHVRCCDRTVEDCCDPHLMKILGRGSVPVADPAAYPALGVIKELYKDTQEQVVKLVREMSADQLQKETVGPPHPMFSNKAGAISMAAMHECFHCGQIALMRRLWGMAPLR